MTQKRITVYVSEAEMLYGTERTYARTLWQACPFERSQWLYKPERQSLADHAVTWALSVGFITVLMILIVEAL